MPGRTIHSDLTGQTRWATILMIAAAAIGLTMSLGATIDPPDKPEQISEEPPASTEGALAELESLSTSAVLIQANTAPGSARNTIRYVVGGNNVVVNIENGTVVDAMLDGVPVPPERIRMMEDRVVLFDELGQEVQTLHVLMKGLDQEFVLRMLGDRMRNRMAGGPGGHWHASDQLRLRSKFVFKGSEPSVMIGMYVERTAPALEYHLGLGAGQTLTVTGLRKGLPAQRADVRQYDVIVSVDGQPPLSRRNFYGTLRLKEPGQSVELVILQEGQLREFTVELVAFDRVQMQTATLIGSDSSRFRHSAFGSLSLSVPEPVFGGILISPDRKFFIDGSMSSSIDFQMNGELQVILAEQLPRIGGMVAPEELIELRLKVEEFQDEIDRVLKRNSEARADKEAAEKKPAGTSEEPTQ